MYILIMTLLSLYLPRLSLLPVHGDVVITPVARIVASEDGKYAVKVLPVLDKEWEEPAVAILFRLNADGTEQVLWRRKLVNVPREVIVYNPHDPEVKPKDIRLITVDTWGRAGYEHALTIYGDRGKVLCDHKLEDLLTSWEILGTPHTVSSRYWFDSADFEYDYEYIKITLSWHATMTFNLTNGRRVMPDEKNKK